MNAMPPDAALPWPGLAGRVARPPRGDPAVAVRLAPPPDRWAVLAAGLAGARLRRHRGRRSSTSAAGTTRTSTRRSACRPAARRRRTRSSATGSTRGRTARRPDRTSTTCTRSSASSPVTSTASRTAGRTSRPSSGSSTSTRRPIAVPVVVARALAGGIGVPASGDDVPDMGLRRRVAGRGARPAPLAADTFRHRPTTGTRGALSWGAGEAPNGLARDLRPDEPAGPTYTSEPLAAPLEVLGVPEVVVHVEVDAPVAMLSVRLSDVAPDGTSALVSAGVLNLTHRRSHADPEPLRPGVVEQVRDPVAHRRLPLAGGPPAAGRGRVVAVAGAVALAASRDLPGPSRARHPVPARAAGRPAGRCGRATCRCRHSGPTRPT